MEAVEDRLHTLWAGDSPLALFLIFQFQASAISIKQ